MEIKDFFKNIPRGKDDAPILLMQSNEVVMNSEDPDNALSMLDPVFSGCTTLSFSKRIDKNIAGTITLDGKPVSYIQKYLNFAGGLDLIGAKVFPYLDGYGKTFTMHIEGFTDTDGNKMKPSDIKIRTMTKLLPDAAFYEREKVALEAAREGIVLLENNHQALPVKKGVLNVFGQGQHSFRESAVGAGKLNSRYTIGWKRAVRESEEFCLNEELSEFYQGSNDDIPPEELLNKAKEKSDTAFMILTRFGGENTDCSTAKGEYYLSDAEETLLKTLGEYFEHTIVILNTPCPIDTGFVKKYGVDGLIYCGFPGMLGGQALLEIISGKVNPSGHLTDSWAEDFSNLPVAANVYDCAKDGPRYAADDADVWIDTVYEEGLYVGYRYLTSFGKHAAYPFGYGLSYTEFEVSTGVVRFEKETGFTLDVTVKNIGDLAGKQVVLIFVGKPENVQEQPDRELVEFAKTRLLNPGESEVLHFEVPIQHLADFDEQSASYVAYEGDYRIFAGTNAESAEAVGVFLLPERVMVREAAHHMVSPVPVKELSKKDEKGTWPTGKRSGIKKGCHKIEPVRMVSRIDGKRLHPTCERKNLTFEDVIQNPKLAHAYVEQLDVQQLCRLVICSKANWDMAGGGMGGYLAHPEGTDIPYFGVADGNSSVRVKPATTGFPASVVYCATYNRSLVKEIGHILGQEAIERKVDLITGPGMNLHRHPLNGRGVEYFSEDPYLTGVMAGNLASGIEERGVGSCYKHFACNNCETSRKRNQSIVSERTLRQLYLKAFEYAIEVCMPASVMTAYNAVNGVHTAADTELLQDILRGEWGFDGYIMTDWNSYDTCDPIEMLCAGNNWLCPGSVDETKVEPVIQAYEEKRLTEAQLKENAAWIIETVARLKKKRAELEKK